MCWLAPTCKLGVLSLPSIYSREIRETQLQDGRFNMPIPVLEHESLLVDHGRVHADQIPDALFH